MHNPPLTDIQWRPLLLLYLPSHQSRKKGSVSIQSSLPTFSIIPTIGFNEAFNEQPSNRYPVASTPTTISTQPSISIKRSVSIQSSLPTFSIIPTIGFNEAFSPAPALFGFDLIQPSVTLTPNQWLDSIRPSVSMHPPISIQSTLPMEPSVSLPPPSVPIPLSFSIQPSFTFISDQRSQSDHQSQYTLQF
jgi:hypothetical protein